MSEFLLPALLAIWIAGMLAKRLPGWGQSKLGVSYAYEQVI